MREIEDGVGANGAALTGVGFSPDGQRIAASATDGEVVLWGGGG